MRDVCTLLPGFAIVILLKPNNSHLQSTKVYKCMSVSGHAMNSEDFSICCNLVSGDALHMAANWPDYLLSCKYVKFLQFHNCAAHLGNNCLHFFKVCSICGFHAIRFGTNRHICIKSKRIPVISFWLVFHINF